ncbi:hypothetical protein UlMin_030689 [Ulmus minor]
MEKKSLLFSLAIIVTFSLASCSSQGDALPNKKGTSPAQFSQVRYHGGPLLAKPSPINVYLIWYGAFTRKERSTITDFFVSFNSSNSSTTDSKRGQPTVSKWWKTIQSYKDKSGHPISGSVRLVKIIGDKYSLGKNIKRIQIAQLVEKKIESNTLPVDYNAVYFVLTAKDVAVERFCISSCGFHDNTNILTKGKVVFAHVGDSSSQCRGFCAWPYAPNYGPLEKPLVAPNSVGTDGMVVNIATVLAGAVTNPFRNGYYQGYDHAPLEAVSACAGKFGNGAYPGFPGKLLVDRATNASYNAYGANGRKFLLPAMWDPVRLSCNVV